MIEVVSIVSTITDLNYDMTRNYDTAMKLDSLGIHAKKWLHYFGGVKGPWAGDWS